jgi:eukaryotic-like serine/threonine-protein kinase
MTRCVVELCENYLAGELSGADEQSFESHLEECPSCRERLDDLAGGNEFGDSVRAVLAATGEVTGSGLLDAAGPAESPLISAALAFLAPSDDPAMLGRVGPYEIRGVLGRGGMGIVLKGYDRALGRNVAIKVLDPAAACMAAARDRFAREARAMAAVSHEHVVPVYGVETHAGLPYFVMEYVAGGTLDRRLEAEGPCDVVSIVRIGLQAAQALEAAHQQGLVHRDIKPANILLDRGTERIRVADFGLARVASDVTCTHSGFLVGTPQFMAPEQVRGETCDARSDLFSLGGVMYAMCTGHAPFQAESVYGVMQRIVHSPAPSIRDQNPRVPAWLEALIFRLLAKGRHERFNSADDVAVALQMELAHLQNPQSIGEPARPWLAGPPGSTAQRLWKRRIAAWSMAAAVVALVLIASTGGRNWFASKDDSPAPSAGIVSVTLDAAPKSTAPLWNADGFDQVREQASSLEALWHAETRDGPDPWSLEIELLRRRLQESADEGADTPILTP